MEKTRLQRYAAGLEKVIQNNYHYLKETMEDFQEKCLVVTSIRTVPQRTVTEINENYREIQSRLNEIKAIQQLIRAKYFLYARRDPIRDKEITEFGNVAKTSYTKFEHGLKEKAGAIERGLPSRAAAQKGPFQWFRDQEKQIQLLGNLRILDQLDYEISPSGVEEQRIQESTRSLTLFVFKGEAGFIDDLQSRFSFREHDIVERYSADELRGVLTHLRAISLSEVEMVFQRFKVSKGYSKLKCLLLRIQSPKHLENNVLGSVEKILQEMGEGELKTVRFDTPEKEGQSEGLQSL